MQVQGDEKSSLDTTWAELCPHLAAEFVTLLVSQDVVRFSVMHRMASNRSADVMARLSDPLDSKWRDARIVAVRLSVETSTLYRSKTPHKWAPYDKVE